MNEKEKFKKKWSKWREAFNGDIQQSIYNQIAYMLLEFLTWKTISEGRGLVADESGGEYIINGMTHHFIDRSYVDSQAMQIRKLVDGAPLTGNKSVYSLLSVLNHMKDCAHLITSENICFAEEIPMTTDEITKRLELYRGKKRDEGLCGVPLKNRSPADKLRDILGTIESDLTVGVVGKVKNYVDKHVAHAATPESITVSGMPLSPDLTFADINSARNAICKGFVDLGNILYGTTQFQLIPFIPGDKFEAIDKPLVRKQDVETLRGKRKEWESEINSIAKQT